MCDSIYESGMIEYVTIVTIVNYYLVIALHSDRKDIIWMNYHSVCVNEWSLLWYIVYVWMNDYFVCMQYVRLF